MRTKIITSSILALAFCAAPALADDQHDHDRDRAHQHDRGYDRDRGYEHHGSRPAFARDPRDHRFHEYRDHDAIRNDPHFRIGAWNYRARHGWGRYHMSGGAWLRTFGIRSYWGITEMTCEAVNQDTGQTYPVSAERGAYGFGKNIANVLLDQSLDNCYADGGGAACAPVAPPCTVQR